MRKMTTKKLALHTETLRNLEALSLEQAVGGATVLAPCSATNVCSGCKPCF
jgi:hypothetical protein